jgi:hypothetical protein
MNTEPLTTPLPARRKQGRPAKPTPEAQALLRLAGRIQAYARRLENLATWQDRLQRHFAAVEAGEQARDPGAALRLQQARRDSGEGNDDRAFFAISWFAETWAESIWDTDPELNELCQKLTAIEQREGLGEFDEFDPDHPETPADWKALNTKSNCRYEEVVRIEDERLVGFLLAHGEPDMADLYASNRAAYDRRREAGRCAVFGPQPDADAETGEGDTGLTQLVAGGQ